MKMQIYPSAAQKDKIEKILRALRLAYNMTFHAVFQKDEMVCTKPNENGDVWPDFRKMSNAKWRAQLIECNRAVAEAPAASLTTNNGIFLLDGQRAWKTGMHNRPVNPEQRPAFRFYNAGKPRRSFMVQIPAEKFVPSPDNAKVAWIVLPKIAGKIKARGFNRKLWFGENGEHTYVEALKARELAEQLTVRVSKDTCGDYYVSVTFSDGKKHQRELYLETPVVRNAVPIGVDVGIKDVAILSNGQKIENKHFKKEKDAPLRRLDRQLSRRWGPANTAYRDYNRELRKENRPSTPLARPGNRYLATQRSKARLERKIARRRDTYYHQQTAMLVKQSSMIAVETLYVKNMLRNHKLAYALADAAMSDFIAKLKYKAARMGVRVVTIGTFEPTSQLCSVCGVQYPQVKNLSIRSWTCPKCGTRHDRDVNAAKNILAIARAKGPAEDVELPQELKPAPTRGQPRRAGEYVIFADRPEIVVVFSKELTGLNDPRYVIVNKNMNRVIDDAQGAGFKSISNAKNCYKAKVKWASKLTNIS